MYGTRQAGAIHTGTIQMSIIQMYLALHHDFVFQMRYFISYPPLTSFSHLF